MSVLVEYPERESSWRLPETWYAASFLLHPASNSFMIDIKRNTTPISTLRVCEKVARIAGSAHCWCDAV